MESKDIVKGLREDMQLNRREFCNYFDIPYRTVQDWECGKRVMPDYVLRLLEYKIRMDQLMQEKATIATNSELSKEEKKQKASKKVSKKSKHNEGFSVCNMCPQDYKAVYQLWSLCDGIGLNEVDDSENGIARFLMRNPGTCFVAKVDEAIVGAVLAGHDGRRGYIYHLAVEQQYRGQGIARQLVNNAVSSLGRLGIQKAGLVVFSDNQEGNEFWERLGFTIREDLTYRNKMTK